MVPVFRTPRTTRHCTVHHWTQWLLFGPTENPTSTEFACWVGLAASLIDGPLVLLCVDRRVTNAYPTVECVLVLSI